MTLVDARYCGGGKDGSRGRFVGVLRPDGATGTLPSVDAHDCRAKLDEVAKRLAAAPDAGAVAVVELVAEWVPWELRVSIGDVAAGGEGGRGLARTLARAKAAGPLTTVETSGLRLATERGSSLTLDLALSFLKGSDGVLSTLTVACPGCAPQPRVPVVNPAGAPADSDAIVGATLRLANRVVALYSEDGPLVLQLDRQEVEIRNLQIGAGEGTLTVRGRATSRAVAESAQVQIESLGRGLEAGGRARRSRDGGLPRAVRAAPPCAARSATRPAGPPPPPSPRAMTSRYRGKPLRTFIAPPPFSFEVGGRRMTLRLTPTRASATGGNLVVYGKADVE